MIVQYVVVTRQIGRRRRSAAPSEVRMRNTCEVELENRNADTCPSDIRQRNTCEVELENRNADTCPSRRLVTFASAQRSKRVDSGAGAFLIQRNKRGMGVSDQI
jgi:hypothetical protein